MTCLIVHSSLTDVQSAACSVSYTQCTHINDIRKNRMKITVTTMEKEKHEKEAYTLKNVSFL
jgi:hypothetical protein